jgi:hypothetical protein
MLAFKTAHHAGPIFYLPSSIFHLPSSIFHLPSSIFYLLSSIFKPPQLPCQPHVFETFRTQKGALLFLLFLVFLHFLTNSNFMAQSTRAKHELPHNSATTDGHRLPTLPVNPCNSCLRSIPHPSTLVIGSHHLSQLVIICPNIQLKKNFPRPVAKRSNPLPFRLL